MNFLINTITAWDEPPRCRHQVTKELVKEHYVVFIERNRLGIPKLEIIHENENFVRVIPYWPIDYRLRHRIPLLNESYQEYVFKKIKQLISEINSCEKWEIINFDFTATRLFYHFSADKITYYCNDDNIGHGNFNPFFINKYHRAAEKKIITKSRNCIATSDFLYSKLSSINKNTRLILLGAPSGIPDQFKVYRNSNKNDEKIKVAYVGFMLPNKLAVDWIQECSGNKRFEFLFIGPENETVKQYFSNMNNIKFLGIKTGDELYSTLSNANVCICPYNVDMINQGTTPNKLWLYLALGKPTVITRIPNMESWQFEDDIIYKIDDKQAFPHYIEKAFLRDKEYFFLKRIEHAEKNTWTQKVDQLLEFLNKT